MGAPDGRWRGSDPDDEGELAEELAQAQQGRPWDTWGADAWAQTYHHDLT